MRRWRCSRTTSRRLTYKNILLRMQANLTSDPPEQQRLIAEADTLRNRALESRCSTRNTGRLNSADGPPPPPPPPFPGFAEPFEQTLARLQPVRVGGNIRTPTKVKDVKPCLPGRSASGAGPGRGHHLKRSSIDQGNIANARVLRSIPLLDYAALSAVSQWQFTPTLLNGAAVGVIMTVTVNFTLVGLAQACDDGGQPVRARGGVGRGITLGAQQPPAQQPPAQTAGADPRAAALRSTAPRLPRRHHQVRVDVTVLNKKGNPITDLAQGRLRRPRGRRRRRSSTRSS